MFNVDISDCKAGMHVCYAALPQPPADFFNLVALNPASVTPSSSSESQTSQAGGQPSGGAPGYGVPPMPMFRPPVGMIPPHLPMGPGGPRRPPPPPPRIGGPPPGGRFPPGMYHDLDSCLQSACWLRFLYICCTLTIDCDY